MLSVTTIAIPVSLQTTTNFGLALLSIFLLNFAGFNPPEMTVISSVAMLVKMTNGVLRLRTFIQGWSLDYPIAIVIACKVAGIITLITMVAIKAICPKSDSYSNVGCEERDR